MGRTDENGLFSLHGKARLHHQNRLFNGDYGRLHFPLRLGRVLVDRDREHEWELDCEPHLMPRRSGGVCPLRPWDSPRTFERHHMPLTGDIYA